MLKHTAVVDVVWTRGGRFEGRMLDSRRERAAIVDLEQLVPKMWIRGGRF